MEQQELGRRIRREREGAAMSQLDLATRSGLDRTAIAKVESGARRLTAIELHRVAGALGLRMARFFEDRSPAIVSHRSSQGLDTAESRVDALLEGLVAEVELVQRLAPESPLATKGGFDALTSPRSNDDAEELAAQAREAMSLDADVPALRLPDLVGRLGLWAFAEDFGPDTADAGSVMLRRGGVALVNSHNKVGRRRLALAHELGHFLVQDEYTVDWRVAEAGSGDELRLDRFARALLLPATALGEVWPDHVARHGLRDAAVIIASRFQVDMSTLARRLEELGLQGDTAIVRSTRTVAADIITHGLQVSIDLDGTSLAGEFQRAVLDLYRGHRISVERTLELLRGTLDEDDLPPRGLRTEGERWDFFA